MSTRDNEGSPPINSKSSTSSNFSYTEAEINFAMNLTRGENASFQLKVKKLNRRNFRKLAQSIKLVMDGKGKLGYQTGEAKKPSDAVLLQKGNPENSSQVFGIKTRLWQTKQGKRDVTDYYLEMTSCSKNSILAMKKNGNVLKKVSNTRKNSKMNVFMNFLPASIANLTI